MKVEDLAMKSSAVIVDYMSKYLKGDDLEVLGCLKMSRENPGCKSSCESRSSGNVQVKVLGCLEIHLE